MSFRVAVKTKNMPKEEWLKYRTKGIGGSDVSVIAGINPFKSAYQLWLEKTGRVKPEQTDSDYAHFGTLLEPLVRKEFSERSGLKVRQKHMLLQSVEHTFMYADLDGVVNDNGSKAVFEAKTASAYKQDVWEKEVPAAYILQVQHYMAVTGYEKTYIAALVGGNHFFYHIVERDEDMIGKIIAMEQAFWEANVVKDVEPVPDGSEATTDYFNKKFKKSNGKTICLPEEALEVCDEYDRLSMELKDLEEKKNAAANRLKALLKDAECGTVGSRSITWKQVSKSYLDGKRLKEENPRIYEDYLKKTSYRRLSVA